jgi:hypothetical protein
MVECGVGLTARFRFVRGLAIVAATVAAPGLAERGLAAPVFGTVSATSPSGQLLALKMTIGDAKTTFELTGPGYSWFSFGFDTTSMEGYSLIIEGLNDNRTAVEQNLLGSGTPGLPQATQNIHVLSTAYDSVNDLSTLVIERANNTGDADDPIFTTSMTSLDVIWAYRASASKTLPSPTLNYHGRNGRGDTTITFSPVPEPASAAIVALGVLTMGCRLRKRGGRRASMAR